MMPVSGGYSIRKALPADVPLLPAVELEAASLYAVYGEEIGLGPDMLAQTNSVEGFRAAQEAGRLWVAADPAGRPVGFALLIEIDGFVHLDELDVLPDHGRKGLGSALLAAVCAWAEANDYPGVSLSTFGDVPWNAPFYARRGFRALPAAELTPGLARLVELEGARGLRTDLRVVMLWEPRRPA
jgi:GNAT superfamily N-acetyltransferase